MRKLIQLDESFPTGEPTIQSAVLWTPSGRVSRERVKVASEAADYIKSVEPKPGYSIILVLALGAYETYGLNRNADGFNEHPYRAGVKPTCGCCTAEEAWVSQAETLPNHFKTFEEYGKIYKHHINSDPAQSYGDVLKAFWNPQMHRVELLLALDNAKAPDIAERITAGEYPAVSMGCRIQYDVCTVCGHRAPTRAKYCEHLRLGLRSVSPNGIHQGALNPRPRFFDISIVRVPADRTGYMLKKVAEERPYAFKSSAELGERLDAMDEKRAALRKAADIDKVVRGLAVDHKTSPLSADEARMVRSYQGLVQPAAERMPELDDATMQGLSTHPVRKVLATLQAHGVILTTPEFIRMLVGRLSPGTRVPEQALDAAVAMQGHLFDFYSEHPELLEQVESNHMFDFQKTDVEPEISFKAQKYIEKRSGFVDYFRRRFIHPDSYDRDEQAYTDTFHVTDPASGQRYATNRGAANAAHDEVAEKELMKMVGGAAALAAAYKLVSSGLPRAARPLAAGTAALAGATLLRPDFGPQYMTEEGEPISTLTELAPQKTAGALPALGTAALVLALGHDYARRLKRGDAVGAPSAPLHARLYDKLSGTAHAHPALSFLAGMGLYGVNRDLFNKFSAYLGDLSVSSQSATVGGSRFDVDRLAHKLGALLFP